MILSRRAAIAIRGEADPGRRRGSTLFTPKILALVGVGGLASNPTQHSPDSCVCLHSAPIDRPLSCPPAQSLTSVLVPACRSPWRTPTTPPRPESSSPSVTRKNNRDLASPRPIFGAHNQNKRPIRASHRPNALITPCLGSSVLQMLAVSAACRPRGAALCHRHRQCTWSAGSPGRRFKRAFLNRASPQSPPERLKGQGCRAFMSASRPRAIASAKGAPHDAQPLSQSSQQGPANCLHSNLPPLPTRGRALYRTAAPVALIIVFWGPGPVQPQPSVICFRIGQAPCVTR